MTTTGWIVAILSFAVALVLGFAACTLIRRRKEKNDQRKIEDAEQEALRIVNEAIKSSENKKREALLEAKEEILKNRSEYEKEVKERRAEQQKQERRLQQKEENLDHKTEMIEKKEEALAQKHAALDKEQEEIKLIKRSQTEMLERISGFTADQAKDYLIAQVESEVTHETALKIKEIEARAKDEADQRAREIVATAIQRCAADHVAEITVSVVPLPNDEMKGRIIGRLHIDEALMDELKAVKAAVHPNEILLVVDAMTGQDAVNAAKAFDDALGIDGVLLTKLDGDARGGAALSIRAVTGKPIKFVGTGEKLDMIEPFHPDRMAGRILGMGDMLTFIEKAEQQYDEKQAKKLEEKLRKNRLTLTDYLDQMEQLQSMGDLSQIADMLPGGMAKGFDPSQIDEKQMAHNKAIIQSMTPLERENPQILNASRKKRIAAGCGLEVVDVNRLLKSFEMLQQMTKAMTKGGGMRGLGGMMGGFGGKVAKGAMHGFGRKKRLK